MLERLVLYCNDNSRKIYKLRLPGFSPGIPLDIFPGGLPRLVSLELKGVHLPRSFDSSATGLKSLVLDYEGLRHSTKDFVEILTGRSSLKSLRINYFISWMGI
ncbi:hypothetical protein M422DRAFT_252286 [Sphaerobolus stellatus SS14]|uniref:Uncharacterized protein n=1 Tax=Sphaerobolus stellatus (strain SS14) TaxID=990650 RepID=A0A0C9VPW8_SPHS4|nr:hypothetical protein M422DRAFT_252286 [Sphaerobolus stellatus SS14]